MPELRQLRTFVAVAEERNFTRAAERLHLGQQAVSKSVQQLERELGVTLLERTTREVRLTAAGAALLESGRAALAAVDDAFGRTQEVGRGLAGRVRVGVSPAVGQAALDDVARALRDGAPELSVSFMEVRPGEVTSRLRESAVDLVLARGVPADDDVDSAELRPTALVLLVPEGHRLAEGPGPATLADLDGERLLTWSPPGTPYTDMLLDRLASAGATVEPVESRVTGGRASADVVELGAVALTPRGAGGGGGIVVVELAEDVTLPLRVLWLRGRPVPAVARLRAALPPA